MVALRGSFVLCMATFVRSTWAVIELDMYRAMASSGLSYPTEDNNLADIVGALKYVATEVIVEGQIGNFTRTARKYDIDTILKSRYWVLNPPLVLAPETLKLMHQDFGPYMAFDNGVATNLPNQGDIANLGDIVGIQSQQDVRFPTDIPFYWASVSGFCPNLPWHEKWVVGAGTHRPNSSCLKYTHGDFVQGGLCGMELTSYTRDATALCGKTAGNGVCDAESHRPTGEYGCTYMYAKSSTVHLDDLAGLTKEDCGGRTCMNWYDFRLHCTNPDYKRIFGNSAGRIITVDRCVEYDLHPACTSSLGCSDQGCMALSPEEKELGVPFWKGRCDAPANHKRVEALAAAFNIPGAETNHRILDPAIARNFTTCLRGRPGPCYPAPPGAGGQYCTRARSGVCTPCKIPGASAQGVEKDVCPYDILSSPDYADFNNIQKVDCGTNKARDLCCLYTSSCEHQSTMIEELPLDDDGFALVASKQDTAKMMRFLNRIATERMNSNIASPEGAEEYAYWQWAETPTGRNISTVIAGLSIYVRARSTTITTTTLLSTSRAMTSTTTTAAAAAYPWRLLALGAATFLCCIGGLVALLIVKPGSKKQAAQTRDARLTNLQPRSFNLAATPTASTPSVPFLIEPVPVLPSMPAPTSPVYRGPWPRGAPRQPVISLNPPTSLMASEPPAALLTGPYPVIPSVPAPSSSAYSSPMPRGVQVLPVVMPKVPMASHAQPQLDSDYRSRPSTATRPFQPCGGYPTVQTRRFR